MHPTRTYIAHLLALALTGLASTAAFADTDGVPSLQLTPTTLNFGDVTVGNSSAAATLTVQGNPGNRGFDQLANVSITPLGLAAQRWHLPSRRGAQSAPSAGVLTAACGVQTAMPRSVPRFTQQSNHQYRCADGYRLVLGRRAGASLDRLDCSP